MIGSPLLRALRRLKRACGDPGDLLGHVCAVLAYALLTFVLTYPVGIRLTGALAQHEDWAYDGLHYVYLLWWAREALLKLHASPGDLRWVNYPLGLHQPLTTTYALFYLMGLALAPLLSSVEAFNVLTLLAFFLSAVSAYALCVYLTDSRWAGFLGGLVYAFFPGHVMHAIGGHLDLILIYPFPLYVLFLIKTVRHPRAANALLCGVALVVCVLVHPLFIPYLLVPITVIWLCYQWVILGCSMMNRRTVLLLLGAFVLAFVSILPFYWPLLRIHLQQGGQDYLEQSGLSAFSADLLGVVAPPPSNPLLNALGLVPAYARRAVPSGWFSSELTVYAGFLPMMLAAVGAWCKRRRAGAWTLIALCSFLLSLGPFLKVGGRLVTYKVGDISTFIPLPDALLARLPLLSLGRTPARFNFTFMLALAVLSAYGVSALLERFAHRWRVVLLLGLCLVTITEYLVMWPYPMRPLRFPAGLSDLASSPDREAVLNLPVTSQRAKLVGLAYQTVHRHPVFDSWVQRPPPIFPNVPEFLDGLLRPLPERDIVPAPEPGIRRVVARELEVGYVLLIIPHANDPQEYARLLSSEFGAPFSVDDDLIIYRVKDLLNQPIGGLADLVYVLPGGRWSQLEDWAGKPARWMPDRAELYLYSPTEQAGTLHFAALPLLSTQVLEITVNGTSLPALSVADSRTYATQSFTLHPGLNGVSFRAQGGCTPFVGDPRCIGPARMAGAECDPYLQRSGQRCLSVLFQDIRFVPTLSSSTTQVCP